MAPKANEEEGGALVQQQWEYYKYPYCFKMKYGAGQKAWDVPKQVIKQLPKQSVLVKNGEALGELLVTMAPAAWKQVVTPRTLLVIEGQEGVVNYLTFKVQEGGGPGEPYEQEPLIPRVIPKAICEKIFPDLRREWQEKLADEEGWKAAGYSDKDKARVKALDWVPEMQLKSQIVPEANGFAVSDPSTVPVSARVDPKKMQRTGGKSSKKKSAADTLLAASGVFIRRRPTCDVAFSKTIAIKDIPKDAVITDTRSTNGMLTISVPVTFEEMEREEAAAQQVPPRIDDDAAADDAAVADAEE